MFGTLLGALMWIARRKRPATVAPLMLRDAVAGAAAAAIVAEALPGGFGIAFIDAPGAPLPNALYLLGAAAGGAMGTLLERSCRSRLIDQ